ncbi:MAG: NAD(P)H-dependent oxidoreductase [Thermoanaerobaculia bacterium]|nr:NAD(P)H-dependent oxidoreductase [Thermoanaerobaculia bacterium]
MTDRPETSGDGAVRFARRVLILLAHPALEKSRVNRRLMAAVRDLPGVTFHDLYQAYPNFHIRVEREQALLASHDVVIFQHPLFWYSTPALLKEWQDLVLQHGWAYGTDGTALRGKWWMHVLTAGGRRSAYRREGYNRYTVRELLVPLQQTANLCGMEFLPPFVVHGTLGMTPGQIEDHAAEYRVLVEAIRDGGVELGSLQNLDQVNDRDALGKRPRETGTDGVSNDAR